MGLSTQREIHQVRDLKPKKQKPAENNLYGTDLSFNGAETQHATHVLHTYVAAINPPLASELIKTYVPQNESVLDPFCGGGGVLVEAILNGRKSAGGEINPLGVLLSKAKTTHISKDRTEPVAKEILHKARKFLNSVDIDSVDPKVRFWFKDSTMQEILAISKAFKSLDLDDDVKNLFKVIFSSAIRDVMLTYRGEIRLRKLKGSDYDKFNPDTFKSFEKRATTAIERVDSLPKGSRSDIDVRDIRNMPFSDNQFHSIVCSPPYADDKNGVGYFQFSKNMLSILGFSPEEIKEHRSMFLGVVTKGKKPPKSKSLEKSLENVLAQRPEKYDEAVAFYSDYARGLAEMSRVVRDNIVIVIGNRVLARTEFDNAAITVDIFKTLGVSLEHHYTRELRKKRIPNLGGDGGGINLEHILVFKK
jgi:DNA modification methylase